MIDKTYIIRVFNNVIGDFDRTVILKPRTYECGYIRSRRSGCYVVTLASTEVRYGRAEVYVEPRMFRKLIGLERPEVCGLHGFTKDELMRMGFDMLRRSVA